MPDRIDPRHRFGDGDAAPKVADLAHFLPMEGDAVDELRGQDMGNCPIRKHAPRSDLRRSVLLDYRAVSLLVEGIARTGPVLRAHMQHDDRTRGNDLY